MSKLRQVLGRAWGLRPRLIVLCVMIAAISATAAAGASYVDARRALIEDATSSLADPFAARVEQQATDFQLPPTQGRLNYLAGTLGNTTVVYQGMRSDAKVAGGPDLTWVTPEMRQAVATGDTVSLQRVIHNSIPSMMIGVPLLSWHTDGTWHASGVEVYTEVSLASQEETIQSLAYHAWLLGGLAAVFAVVVALLAACRVLRPVRELGVAARRLGSGDLRARLRVRGNDELAELAKTFNDTANALEGHVSQLRRMESDARRFVADVSHELRTPLAAMTAVTEVLDEEAPQLGGDAGQAARLVSQETRKLTRLVEDLMEVSRFDAGAARLALDDIDIASAVSASLLARGWVGQVVADLPAGVVARVDARRLDVIVANLVGNALRHGMPPVEVTLWADRDWVELRVSDKGPGLDPEVLPHVFDRFYKADSSRARSEGSGLGLAIAWENARLHTVGGLRGSLEAANGPDGGAVFVLKLPRNLDEKGQG